MNTLFVRITEIAKNTFCMALIYQEDGERFTIKTYSDNQFQLLREMDSALENARYDGFKIDWRPIKRL